ncbi:MAG: class I SAM-dependent methyltransferase [Campylobacterota bacterium]|nr:class I SAM-dependent methyltransferase [Campylobacterota bacterium]
MNRFDIVASTWDSNSKRLNIASSAVEKIKLHVALNKEQKLLDYGCGTGLMGFGLSDEVKEVVGMDNSQGMLDEFNKKAKDLEFNNITCKLHNISDNHIGENEFDVIVSSMTLHHIENTEDFILKAYQSLKDGGYLCINDLESEDGSFHEHSNDGVFHFGFDKESLRTIFKKVGFEVTFLETIYSVEKSKSFPVFLIIAKK